MNDQVAFYRDKVAKQREENSAFEATVAQRAAAPPKSSLEPLPVTPLFDKTDSEQQQRLLGALLDKEFWTQDITRSAVISGKNLVAGTVGLMGDIQSLLPGPKNSLYRGPTAEEVAKFIGGDTSHPSWWPMQFLAPGPGEMVGAQKAILGGLIGWTKGLDDFATGAAKYADFIKLEKKLGSGPMDMRTVAETGWVRGHDGAPKFIIDDSKMLINDVPLKEGKNVMLFGDLVSHDELYKSYPDVANIKVTVWGEKLEDGTVAIRKTNPEDGGSRASFVRQGLYSPDKINIYAAKGPRALKASLLHEASHFIQEAEGFSSGSSIYTAEYVKELATDVVAAKMLKKFSPEELDDTDTVLNFIMQGLGPEADPKTVQELSHIARIYSRMDDFSYTNELGIVQAKVDEGLSRLGHVFEYVLRKKDPNDTEKIMSLLDGPDNPELLSSLTSHAYRDKLGELEARLAGLTQDWDMARWAQVKEDPIEAMMRIEAGEMAPEGTKLADEILIGRRGDRVQKAKAD